MKKITVNPKNKKALKFFDNLDTKKKKWEEKADEKLESMRLKSNLEEVTSKEIEEGRSSGYNALIP